jgi:hypothetical protein
MAGLSSPLRLAPPMTPRRAPSPTMSPGGRRGRMHGSSEEGRLRDLSPDTTLRAFTQRPVPFDTSCDEYRIFACIDSLTAAERDLGARVAKAAQRLKSWCSEIEQWGWSGSFEQPSDEYREKRRRSLELRIREHVGDADLSSVRPPLEYWGSILSVEVESHEARLDDIEEEMLKLDVEELKEHVLDMHPSGRSRPSSAGYEATRQNYKPMDDFSFLITQTLLSALPHHAQLKDRLSTWTARISTLREVPRYLDDLHTAQKAMRLGWNAIDPPADTSDAAFVPWKDAVDTISGVLGNKVSDLGKRLDRMLDNLEGRDDCIPDNWIDIFESIESDYGRWSHESRRKVMDFDLRRRYEQKVQPAPGAAADRHPEAHSNGTVAAQPGFETADRDNIVKTASYDTEAATKPEADAHILASDNEILKSMPDKLNSTPNITPRNVTAIKGGDLATADFSPTPRDRDSRHIVTPGKVAQKIVSDTNIVHREVSYTPVNSPGFGSPRVREFTVGSSSNRSTPSKKPWFMTDATASPSAYGHVEDGKVVSPLAPASAPAVSDGTRNSKDLHAHPASSERIPEVEEDEESEFDEGDTVVHNDLEDDLEEDLEPAIPVQTVPEIIQVENGETAEEAVPLRHRPTNLSENPVIITNDGQDGPIPEPPQTPRSRRDSQGSVSSSISFDDSSPPSYIEDSPSVRNATNRSVRAPRPELNAAMAKRRLGKSIADNSIDSAPWPPTQFSQKSSAEDLERKISDILTTIPAHIRLTSGPSADSPEVKPSRGLATRGSRAYLRAARSVSGLKSPELTLSPAKNEFDSVASGRKSAAATRTDNDIKLYHLTQPGKEQPVKLFIRRVGENGERVMVRVGGGWADLGEYLRQYAEHHGRRTASDGKFEILGLEVKNNDNTNSPNRPDSAAGRQDRRVSSGRPTASPLTTPTKSSATGASIDNVVLPMPSFSSTPGIAEEPSVPSTNSSQRSWTGNEAGLAGPKGKKLDLSGEKLEWIEGMMKQARTVSGNIMPTNNTPHQREERADSRSESRSDSRAGGKKPEFGDLGKVGGTKRIFLRGGKPVME